MKGLYRFLVVPAVIVLSSCGGNEDDEQPVIKSSEKKIEIFSIEDVETQIVEADKIVNVITGASETDFTYSPTINVSNNATVFPKSGTAIDFANEPEFTVTAEDGTKEVYESKLVRSPGLQGVRLKSSREGFSDIIYQGVIDENDQKVIIDFESSFTAASLGYTTSLEIDLLGTETSSLPVNNSEIDINTLDELQITTSNTTKLYALVFRNTENKLFCFQLPVVYKLSCALTATSTYDGLNDGLTDDDYVFFTLEDQNITNLIPSVFNVSSGATVTPDPEQAQDFTEDVSYQITSESGSVNDFKVRVVQQKVIMSNSHSPIITSAVRSTSSNFFNYYYGINKITEATLINKDTSAELNCQIAANNYVDSSTETYIVFGFETQPEIGDQFLLRVTLEDGSVVEQLSNIVIIE